MIPHWKREFDATEFPSAMPTKTRIATATHRPGWRTGIAWISSGAAGSAVSVAIPSLGAAPA